jgi:hypothetical protein
LVRGGRRVQERDGVRFHCDGEQVHLVS